MLFPPAGGVIFDFLHSVYFQWFIRSSVYRVLLVQFCKMYSYTCVKLLIYKIHPNKRSIEKLSPKSTLITLCFYCTTFRRNLPTSYSKQLLLGRITESTFLQGAATRAVCYTHRMKFTTTTLDSVHKVGENWFKLEGMRQCR